MIIDDYAAPDLETTGFSPTDDRIIEFGAVRVRRGKPVSTYARLVNLRIKTAIIPLSPE
jgi:DNA polymerase III alpha subunit (gram-positive type)